MSCPPRHDIAGKAGPQARHYCISPSLKATAPSSAGISGHLLPPVTPDASVGFTAPAGGTPDSLTASTTVGWTTQPAASSGGPSQQHHTLQETRQHPSREGFPTNPPHQPFVLGVQGYTSDRHHQASTLWPSNDPRLRAHNGPSLSTDAHAPVPVHGSATRQNACNGGVASTQRTGEATQCDPRDFIHLTPASPVSVQPIGYNSSPVQSTVTGPLPDGFAKLCVCSSKFWIASCPRAQEHYDSAMLNPSQHPCRCGWVLSKAQLPKWCPKATSHFLDWKKVPNNLLLSQLSEFEKTLASNSIAPRTIYKGTSSQDTARENAELSYRSTRDPRERESQESRVTETETNTLTPLPHLPRDSFTSPFTYGACNTIQETSEPPDVDRSSHPPAGMTRHSTPARTRTDAGPSRRRDAGALVDLMDGFKNPDLPPEVRQAMRRLVCVIRDSIFVNNHMLEPIIGTHDANTLMAVAPPELWTDYETKGGSIYYLFIKVDGEAYECLWCGEIYWGKPLRALGHFRDKHLGHKPFICHLVHDEERVCQVRFSTREAMEDHRRRKKKLKTEGKLQCSDCGHWYTSISNFNRHECPAEMDNE